MVHRISLFTRGGTDLPRARFFYADGLGWTQSALSIEQITFFQCGGVVSGLYGHAALAADSVPDRDAGDGFWSEYSGYFADPNCHPRGKSLGIPISPSTRTGTSPCRNDGGKDSGAR